MPASVTGTYLYVCAFVIVEGKNATQKTRVAHVRDYFHCLRKEAVSGIAAMIVNITRASFTHCLPSSMFIHLLPIYTLVFVGIRIPESLVTIISCNPFKNQALLCFTVSAGTSTLVFPWGGMG